MVEDLTLKKKNENEKPDQYMKMLRKLKNLQESKQKYMLNNDIRKRLR